MSSTRLSKFLSLVLRHDPARIGITLDDAGWTDVSALVTAAAKHGTRITREQLVELVASSDKQRFALSPDGARIRANQGHSVEVDLQLAQATPPERLYHGTVAAALPGIRAEGLTRGTRHHVHLSPDTTTATKVGARRGSPILLTIRAGDMAAAGHAFYRSENNVWLVERVPPEFIDFHNKGPRGSGGNLTRGAKTGVAKSTLAACEAGEYTNAHDARVALRAAIERAKEGTVHHELKRIAIAEHTLAAVDGGRYVNSSNE